jgi:translocation and assembly module TamA
MASLSSFRPPETQRRLKLGLAIAAGLGQTTLALNGAPAAAAAAWQPTVPPEQGDADSPEDAVVEASPAPEPAPPPPEPVPKSLDDLIPEAAVADPEGWAAGGVADQATAVVPVDPLAEVTLPGFDAEFADLDSPVAPDAPVTAEGMLADLAAEGMLADLAIDDPQPLPSNPALEELAAIAAPTIAALPELSETRISNLLTLALPTAPEAFPERAEFIDRFEDLSNLRALGGGEENAPQISARARADEDLLADILRTYGYYAGDVLRQLSGGRGAEPEADEAAEAAARQPSVRFDILPGPRYRFGRIDLGGLPALPEPDASRLIAAFGIQPGDPLYADRIVERELELRVALGESGYPFAEVAEPELLIDHAREEGDLTLDVAPKGKYVFGEVVSSDPRFLSGRHLGRIARFDPGDVFRQSLETDLRRAIIATGLVSSVTVTPRETRAPQDGQPGEVALDVAMERAPLRTIAGAIGYGTEDGLKVEGRWEHRNLFPPEGALRLRGILGTREALASVGIRRNNFRGRDQVLTVDLFASDINTLAVDSRGFGMRATFEKVSNILFQKPLSWQVGGELLYTDERNIDRRRNQPNIFFPRQAFLIGGLLGSVTIDASDDLLDPTEGYRATLFLAPEVSRSRGMESYYLRAQGDASYYKSLGDLVLAGRVRAATIQGAAAIDIAPSRRLYGGGGGSVRGYGFQGIGPRDRFGNPEGGASLIEFAVEARIPTPFFDGNIQVAPFIDAGSVSRRSSPDLEEIRFGAGIGIRYKTTFGPIRIDVATPLNPAQFDSPVVVYVSLGQAF